MSVRRAVGFLLTRRFSPRVIPRTTAPARSFHSLKELPNGVGLRGAAGVAAVACAGAGAWAAQYFRKGTDDVESAARKKEGEMKAVFENWMKEFNKTYRDEEEKTIRFQVFKDTVKWIESRPLSTQEVLLPPNCFADLTREERPCSHSC
uniref:Cathepsin propeptide inhibitor domain-containing protein n=1 Tax=Triticum urartu TaxID=4572 RepID=A0A8R7QI65_TRIUA